MVFGLISLGLCGAPFSIGLKQLFVIISTSVGCFFYFFLFHRFDCKMIYEISSSHFPKALGDVTLFCEVCFSWTKCSSQFADDQWTY